MSNSSDFDFVGLYTEILADVGVYFPHDLHEWRRDLVTLRRASSTRGLPFFTIDLPALRKLLDGALASGALTLVGTPFSRSRHPGSMIPRLFWGLWSRVFDDKGCLKQDIDPNVVFFLRTLLDVGKNLEMECAPKYLYEATKEFFDVEKVIPSPSPNWDGEVDSSSWSSDISVADISVPSSRESLLTESERELSSVLHSIQRESDRIAGIIGWVSPADLSYRHGPGVVSDAKSGTYKYVFEHWSPSLEDVVPYDLYGTTLTGLIDVDPHCGVGVSFVEGASSLKAVPKTQKGPRLIAAEPKANQWVQQGIRDFLYTRVDATVLSRSLTFRDQRPSQQMALQGSLDGSYATIDLKSASDRVSCWLVERVFRRNRPLLDLLRASRTKFLTNEIDKKHPKLIKLRKFSTQGSALTFPIQSLVFLAVCMGVGRHLNPRMSRYRLHGMVRVFGDDIIVPNSWEPLVRTALHALYLKVNPAKTFSEGNFRESCGMDAFRGYDVTPPHVTLSYQEASARTVASLVAVSNNFHSKGWWRAADWIRSTIRRKNIPVVDRRSGAFGYTSYTGAPIPSRMRWNVDLQRDEYWRLLVVAKSARVSQDNAACLLQYFTEEPEPYIDYESGIAVSGTPTFRSGWGSLLEVLAV